MSKLKIYEVETKVLCLISDYIAFLLLLFHQPAYGPIIWRIRYLQRVILGIPVFNL